MSRKLDAAIAEALGYEVVVTPTDGKWDADYYMRLPSKEYMEVLNYFADGNAMLELVAEMRARGWGLQVSSIKNGYIAKFCTGRSQSGATAETMPEAVALAAYKALTEGKGRPECNI